MSLLWSMVQPTHERSLAELIREMLPGWTHAVQPSSRLAFGDRAPSLVVVNAYVGPLVGGYLDRLGQRLAASGFGGELLVMTWAAV